MDAQVNTFCNGHLNFCHGWGTCAKHAPWWATQGVDRVFETMEAARAAIESARPLLTRAVELSDEVRPGHRIISLGALCCAGRRRLWLRSRCSPAPARPPVHPLTCRPPPADHPLAHRAARRQPGWQCGGSDAGGGGGGGRHPAAAGMRARGGGGGGGGPRRAGGGAGAYGQMRLPRCLPARCAWAAAWQPGACPPFAAPPRQTEVLTEANVRALRESVQTLTKTLQHIERITGAPGRGMWGSGWGGAGGAGGRAQGGRAARSRYSE